MEILSDTLGAQRTLLLESNGGVVIPIPEMETTQLALDSECDTSTYPLMPFTEACHRYNLLDMI